MYAIFFLSLLISLQQRSEQCFQWFGTRLPAVRATVSFLERVCDWVTNTSVIQVMSKLASEQPAPALF